MSPTYFGAGGRALLIQPFSPSFRARACAAFYRCNVTPVVTLRSFRTMARWCQESFLARVLVAALLVSLLHPTQAHAVPEYEPSKTPDHDGGRSLLGPSRHRITVRILVAGRLVVARGAG